MSILGQFQFRRDSAANWSSANPILLDGEMGIESDTRKFKPIVERDGVWQAEADEAATQAAMDAYTPAMLRADIVRAVRAHASALREAAVADYDNVQRDGWARQVAEAAAWRASRNPSDAPGLAAEAAAAGLALAVLVATVERKALDLAVLNGHINGVSKRHEIALAALDDFAGLLAYDLTAGWPDIEVAAL